MPATFKGTAPQPYDEIFAAAGTLRYPYIELRRRLGVDPLRPAAPVWRYLRDRPLGDDTRILPIPWALDGREYSRVIQAAASQRAHALQMFFADLVLGPQRFLPTTSLTPELLELILRESEGTSLADLRSLWDGHEPEEIRFIYGPDLVRGSDGLWYVLEENVGCIGCCADGHLAWDRYLNSVTARSRGLSSVEPDLQAAACHWLQGLSLTAGTPGVVALMPTPDGVEALNSALIAENPRRQMILEKAGLTVADVGQLKLLLSENGDWRVKAIFNFYNGSELVEEAFRRRIPLMSAPGTEILGNKALMPHVDEMIRFFLGEQPIITHPPMHVCHDGALPAEQGDWVIKSASGSQGTGVYMLQGQPPQRLAGISELVQRSWPEQVFVAQRRIEPSRLSTSGADSWEGYPVQLRPVTYVTGWSQVHVSGRPVGKAVWGFDIYARHNLGQGACCVPTIVLEAGTQGVSS